MKKLFLLLFLLISIYSQSQTYIKVNAITALVLVPNIGIETSIGKKSTFQFDVLASFWSSIDGKPREFYTFTPEYRYHFHEKYNGFYAGANIGASIFNVQKPTKDYWGTDMYEKGFGYFVGATIGYQKKINNRFMLDIFLGGGWHQSYYNGYYISTGERYEFVEHHNKSGEWLPYRGGLMISYRLN
ncbi:DUF3575 domain-containing protein [Flavobacterium sp. 5]|uniref:DUF3575 domain-containing protein n=1 Tax=Flavobacterium sp. 5 TaxID=2035199 RepID=UPI000C2C6077|nr:DUF3575 domain-containing protein [Flavobacterium sp. 5]PKB18188.1 uncharacterized protein DUF3575 [Flavobacterium sp. 5]